MTLTASVVIPTYHGRERLMATVPALLAEDDLHELVVVVDGSEDGSLQLLEGWAADDPRLVPVFIANAGDNAARQVGAERASGDVVVFLDDDVVAEPGMLAGHLRHHAEADGRVVIGYMPVAPDGPPRADDYPRRLYARWYEAQCRDYEERPDGVLENLWNGNVSMRRADCLRVGIPNPAYDARYGPDRDLGLRLDGAGLVGIFDRSIRARHQYVRPPERFFADVHSAGEGIWLCHRLYPDVLGPLTCERFERGMGPAGRRVVRLARRPRASRLLDAALRRATDVAGRARQWGIQERIAALRARVVQQRGALDRSHADRRGRS